MTRHVVILQLSSKFATPRRETQNALEVYRRDQKSHHEQSIASDLTRGLLRKIFRETVLESSKQVGGCHIGI